MRRLLPFLLTLLALVYTHELSAHPGIGIVMDSQGNVFYTDLTHVWKIDPAGERTIAVENVQSSPTVIT